jgi:predicted  nucleic acid-binding Zn-ribbon protein
MVTGSRQAVAPKMRVSLVMKSYIHDIVSRLLELRALEERLDTFNRSREDTSDVEALIDSLRANIPLSVLLDYDRMRGRGKRSVAAVCHGVCSACHLALGLGNVAALRRGDLCRCGNCGRYLYLVEEEDEPTDSSTPLKKHDALGSRPAEVK